MGASSGPSVPGSSGRQDPTVRCLAVLILIAAIGLVSTGIARAEVKVSGTVRDEADRPVTGMKVLLTPVDKSWNPTGATVSSVKVNKRGKFTFGFAKPGDYLLAVEAEELQILSAAVRLRDGERKPVYGPEGIIEDRSGAVDPARPVVALGIPRDAFYVEVDVVVGKPKAVASGSSAAIQRQIVRSGLADEVGTLLAKLDALQFQAAVDEVELLIAQSPELAPLHYLKGYALVKLAKLPEAEAALNEALRLDPAIGGASGLLGQILGEQGRFEEAVPALRRELEREDESTPRAPLLLGLGQALLETGAAVDAVAVLEQAHGLEPDNPNFRAQLVDAYTRAGQEEKAEQLMTEGLDVEAAAILHYNLAANMLRTERWDRAIEHLQEALALNPGLVQAHNYLAQAYTAQGKLAEAIAAYEAYLAAAPDAPDAEPTRRIVGALRQILEEQ